jgi:hypothetical protein
MFVVPSKVSDRGSDITMVLPYVPSHLFGELVFANAGAKPTVAAILSMLRSMATSLWTEGQEKAKSNFIQQAHFDRMKRRVGIARKEDTELDAILQQKTVILNGRRVDGFDTIMKKLEQHPALSEISPKVLNEIHGDLNIHNVLGRLDCKHSQPVVLIDPRGVPLLNDSEDESKKFERGDYCYDISKLLFSLTGFSEIRKGLFDYSTDGESHQIKIQRHPGSSTMSGAAELLIPALKSDKVIERWINEVECNGTRSFELRVWLGEAAYFIADCACALGRNTPWETVPLFLLGLQKLNDVFETFGDHGGLAIDISKRSRATATVPESAELGATMIQEALLNPTSGGSWSFDILEICTKAESAHTLQRLLRGMIGIHLPKDIAVHLSTDPVEPISQFPLVVIHQSHGVKGQTHMLAAATRKTTAFLRDNGVSQSTVNNLKILHISSTGSSSRSQLTARDNDKLLSPGTFGISPLQLSLLQVHHWKSDVRV